MFHKRDLLFFLETLNHETLKTHSTKNYIFQRETRFIDITIITKTNGTLIRLCNAEGKLRCSVMMPRQRMGEAFAVSCNNFSNNNKTNEITCGCQPISLLLKMPVTSK